MFYYKDTATGTQPLAVADELSSPSWTQIDVVEWTALMNAPGYNEPVLQDDPDANNPDFEVTFQGYYKSTVFGSITLRWDRSGEILDELHSPNSPSYRYWDGQPLPPTAPTLKGRILGFVGDDESSIAPPVVFPDQTTIPPYPSLFSIDYPPPGVSQLGKDPDESNASFVPTFQGKTVYEDRVLVNQDQDADNEGFIGTFRAYQDILRAASIAPAYRVTGVYDEPFNATLKLPGLKQPPAALNYEDAVFIPDAGFPDEPFVSSVPPTFRFSNFRLLYGNTYAIDLYAFDRYFLNLLQYRLYTDDNSTLPAFTQVPLGTGVRDYNATLLIPKPNRYSSLYADGSVINMNNLSTADLRILEGDPDSIPPSKPQWLVISETEGLGWAFAWQPSVDNLRVRDYTIQEVDAEGNPMDIITVVPQSSFTYRGDPRGRRFWVYATDIRDNVSAPSPVVVVPPPPPGAPQPPVLAYDRDTRILSWSAVPTVTSYALYLNGNAMNISVEGTQWEVPVDLTTGANKIAAQSVNSAGRSGLSNEVSVAATAPPKLQVVYDSAARRLKWSAAQGATSYQVLRDGTLVKQVVSIFYDIPAAWAGTTNTVTVKAIGPGGTSAESDPIQVTVESFGGGGEPPLPPAPAVPVVSYDEPMRRLTWGTVEHADHYEISDNDEDTGVKPENTFYEIPSGFAVGEHKLRVRAVGRGGTSAYSTPAVIVVIPPGAGGSGSPPVVTVPDPVVPVPPNPLADPETSTSSLFVPGETIDLVHVHSGIKTYGLRKVIDPKANNSVKNLFAVTYVDQTVPRGAGESDQVSFKPTMSSNVSIRLSDYVIDWSNGSKKPDAGSKYKAMMWFRVSTRLSRSAGDLGDALDPAHQVLKLVDDKLTWIDLSGGISSPVVKTFERDTDYALLADSERKNAKLVWIGSNRPPLTERYVLQGGPIKYLRGTAWEIFVDETNKPIFVWLIANHPELVNLSLAPDLRPVEYDVKYIQTVEREIAMSGNLQAVEGTDVDHIQSISGVSGGAQWSFMPVEHFEFYATKLTPSPSKTLVNTAGTYRFVGGRRRKLAAGQDFNVTGDGKIALTDTVQLVVGTDMYVNYSFRVRDAVG